MSNVFIIAEAGVNHNGDIEIAKKLIDVASESGVDAVKFQTFKTEKLVSKNAPKAEYQRETTKKAESQFDMIKKLELDQNTHKILIEYCRKKNIMFLSTPFDLDSMKELNELGVEIFKIPSGEINNLPYLRQAAKLGKPLILSTGMSNLAEIEEALSVLYENGCKDITVLHCNTEYPTPIEDVNLNAMITIRDAFKVKVGYSDHTLGIEIPIAATSMGAQVIEKHFTLDKNMDGPDHKASLEPNELKDMVKSIRNIELALGNGIKKPSKSEYKNKAIARKSIVALTKIKQGDVFTENNITVKRPGNGISPMLWDKIIGTVSNKNYDEDELINI
ncbi:N-acetylneuraminate synthase [Paraclostridium bifermentans]|uniref:N-acetylneuraminate synthase n=1 Tax=Paraclostridium bifermentans TaxID=1490 RepID=UPI0022E7FF50|nr:N-acetylneuraminate synthase [Paraclostridium bifermentans]